MIRLQEQAARYGVQFEEVVDEDMIRINQSMK